MGTFKQGDPTGTSVKLELSYLKITRDNALVLELDKFNHVYSVEGRDYLKEIRDLI